MKAFTKSTMALIALVSTFSTGSAFAGNTAAGVDCRQYEGELSQKAAASVARKLAPKIQNMLVGAYAKDGIKITEQNISIQYVLDARYNSIALSATVVNGVDSMTVSESINLHPRPSVARDNSYFSNRGQFFPATEVTCSKEFEPFSLMQLKRTDNGFRFPFVQLDRFENVTIETLVISVK